MIGETVGTQLYNQALEMIIIFDKQGTITFANTKAYELLEYHETLVGKNVSLIFPGAFSVKDGMLSIMVPLDGSIQEIMAYRSNHTCFSVNNKLIRVCDKDHEQSFVNLALDISKETMLEKLASAADEQAESAQLVKTQFVANVTHELRTPVNGILGNTRELMKFEDDAQKRRLLNLIERGCNDMHSIINNILDFSKLDAGKMELEKEPFVFREMMDYIKSNHINKISEKGLQFFMTISPDIPEKVIGDQLRIGQVLNNLLSNATKFTSLGKIMVEVLMTARMQNKIELFFIVIDSGIGISKEDQDKLFKSFSQVEASTTRKYGGTGLGLNISKQLVERMGGSIHVESEKGKGTMFSFHIWVEVPEENNMDVSMPMRSYDIKVPGLSDLEDSGSCSVYGSPENIDEIRKKASKLILCVEMENWEKAEMFMDTIRQLTQTAPQPVKSATLRLKMAVQKADVEKTREAYEVFKKEVFDED